MEQILTLKEYKGINQTIITIFTVQRGKRIF